MNVKALPITFAGALPPRPVHNTTTATTPAKPPLVPMQTVRTSTNTSPAKDPDARMTLKLNELTTKLNEATAELDEALTEISDLERRLAKLEAVITVSKSGQVGINGGHDLRIVAAKVRIDAPAGVEVQPRLSTTLLNATMIDGAKRINCVQVNNIKFIKIPPFIVPAL